MQDRLRHPPLNAVRAFVAAARLGSLKAAAADLGVTAGAVSRHVRQLEEDPPWMALMHCKCAGAGGDSAKAGWSSHIRMAGCMAAELDAGT